MSAPAARARIERRDLLVELGTEELPPKALRTLELAFAEGLRTRLTQAGLIIASTESFATPRRLAVHIRRLPVRAPDQKIKRRGPPVSASYDAGGLPTRAALAFAHSCGVPLESIERERDAKGNEYLSFEGVKAGTATSTLLPGLVQQSLEALPVPRRMRWGSGEAQFVRPVHWLLLLFGHEVLPATLLGVESGARTFGHRFMVGNKPLHVAAPGRYAATLLSRGKVLAAFEQRREAIRGQVETLATSLSGRAILTEALLEEVTALVEWPVALAGQFEQRFLSLPREVLISTLQDHQRYFAVENDAGLMPWFIAISNIDSPDPDVVRSGNERVVRPRLADAAFFWEQDRKQPLAERRAALDAVTFHEKLGSLGARTDRITTLAVEIAPRIGADERQTQRAAQLCKCDLLSAMVGEFPELQGIMGRYYALADGEAQRVAEALREHYLPRAAGDALPASTVGDAVALADKLDTLAGIFATGQKPSGTRDPFGLRRAAIGLLRIVLEHRHELNLVELIERALRLQPIPLSDEQAAAVAIELYDFLMERARAQYLERGGEDRVTTEMFDAVLAARPVSLLDLDARLRALPAFVARPEGISLAAANKRIANILRKSGPASSQSVRVELLQAAAERELQQALTALRTAVSAAVEARDYARALELLAGLRPKVDAFFDQVLVNDPDAALRDNRLALLAELRAAFGSIADLSRLPG
ncbi:MAG TPA: glycine--tRNA ligase subunit beta [Steroidobacteraceae bacterium]|jgi:glycyl-tRNA synthetase beta chain